MLSNSLEWGVGIRSEIYDNFDPVVFSHLEHVIKPGEEIYLRTLHGLQRKDPKIVPKTVFFVDDRAENIETAERLGIHGILFERPPVNGAKKLRADLRDLGVRI